MNHHTGRRFSWLDGGLLLCLAAGLIWLGWRIHTGLEYTWNWKAVPQYLFRQDESGTWVANLLIEGLLTTIRLSIWSTFLAILIGVGFGLARISRRPFLRLLAQAYVGLVRPLPPLVLIYIVYFFLSDQFLPLIGVPQLAENPSPETAKWMRWLFAEPSLFPNFISGVFTLAVLEGAYITEIVRAGIESIETDQWEGAAALGLTRTQQLIHVILPQAFRRTLPALAGQFISTIKDSAIVSVISIQELTFKGMELMAATYMALETWIVVTLLYFVLTFSCSLLLHRLERSWDYRSP